MKEMQTECNLARDGTCRAIRILYLVVGDDNRHKKEKTEEKKVYIPKSTGKE